MKEGRHVRIVKDWHSPAISIDVTHSNGSLEISMPLTDFVKALAAEAGNPAKLLTVAQLERKLLTAADAVTTKMKQQTAAIA